MNKPNNHWHQLVQVEPRLSLLEKQAVREVPSAADAEAFLRYARAIRNRLRHLLIRRRLFLRREIAERHLLDKMELQSLRRAFDEGRARIARQAAKKR